MEAEAVTTIEDDLPPTHAPATWFPGRVPKEVIKQLKAIDKDIDLRWSPRFEVWEVWHKSPKGEDYVFYRHYHPLGGYMSAENRLLSQVLGRANWTQSGQEWIAEQKHRVRDHSIDTIKDPDYVKWSHARGRMA